jgi:hypothetical protein
LKIREGNMFSEGEVIFLTCVSILWSFAIWLCFSNRGFLGYGYQEEDRSENGNPMSILVLSGLYLILATLQALVAETYYDAKIDLGKLIWGKNEDMDKEERK